MGARLIPVGRPRLEWLGQPEDKAAEKQQDQPGLSTAEKLALAALIVNAAWFAWSVWRDTRQSVVSSP